jgi:four helix bundle protein
MLVAYAVAIELVKQLRPIVEQIKMHDAHLADQLKRAATNTVANLAEGQRRAAGNKRRAYENAHGEAREMLGCLDCALAWGYATDDGAARRTLDRLPEPSKSFPLECSLETSSAKAPDPDTLDTKGLTSPTVPRCHLCPDAGMSPVS